MLALLESATHKSAGGFVCIAEHKAAQKLLPNETVAPRQAHQTSHIERPVVRTKPLRLIVSKFWPVSFLLPNCSCVIDGLRGKRPPSLLSHGMKDISRSHCLWREIISSGAILNRRGLNANNMHTLRPGFVKRDKEINLCPRSVQFHNRSLLDIAGVRRRSSRYGKGGE